MSHGVVAKRLRSLAAVTTAVDSICKDLDTVSEASSARGSMCHALLLSNSAVLEAVAAALILLRFLHQLPIAKFSSA